MKQGRKVSAAELERFERAVYKLDRQLLQAISTGNMTAKDAGKVVKIFISNWRL